MNFTKQVITSIIIGGGLVASCAGEPDGSAQSEKQPLEENVQPKVEVKEDFVLPSTVQIGELFRSSGLKYADGVTLDPTHVENFNSTYSKYLGFGVYWVDMTYCILNHRSQDASKYMTVVRGLGDQMGASELFNDQDLLERFERNLDNHDSILNVLIDIDQRTDAFVEDNAQEEMALVNFVGGWIEGMYIGFSTESLDNHSEVTGRIMEQMVILDNLLKGVKPLAGNDAKLDKVIDQLTKLHEYYLQIPEIANVEGPISEVEIPLNHLKVIGDHIVELRNIIIE